MRGRSDLTVKEWLNIFNGEHYINDIAVHVGITKNAVHCHFRRLQKLGFNVSYKKKYKLLTAKDREFISENVGVMSVEGIADKLGYPVTKIERYIALTYPVVKRERWTDKEDEFLLRNYKNYPFPEVIKCLARTPKAIVQRVYRLNKKGRKFKTKEKENK